MSSGLASDLASQTSPRPFASMRVLVADDNRDAADTLAELITMELGCEVAAVYDGRSALQRVMADPPDVLILDVRMPDLGGVEVARELARHPATGPRPSLLLAVTGTEVSDALADVDGGCFHGAFAKPVDAEALVGRLRRHWRGESDGKPQATCELSNLLCEVARKSVPMLRARGHVLSFDYRGPSLQLEGDEAPLHAGLYRLLCGVADMVDAGFTVFKASVEPGAAGDWALDVQVAAAGTARSPSVVGEVLARLGLADAPVSSPAGVTARSAFGTCPRSGAQVHCLVVPSDGVLFRFGLACRPLQALEASVDAQGARAWLIDPKVVPSALLQRRLQRLGWRVRRFESFAHAMERVTRLKSESAPDLVVAMEVDDAQVPGCRDLQAVLPPGVHCIRVVPIGSAALRERDTSFGGPVHIDPLSPGELIELTRRLYRNAPADADATPTASAALQDRPRLLVVDDVEVNRIVASGLAAALGYEVAVVADGLDAIQHCRLTAPDVVLMDVNMPVLGGIDTTQRIRHLQRLGQMAPFPIIAATANDDQQTVDRCREVGMDGFVRKPLALQVLREELLRVTLNAPQ
jgi:CheY-like chemotaxis protein